MTTYELDGVAPVLPEVFTVAELLVIAVIIFWLTKNSVLYIIELL